MRQRKERVHGPYKHHDRWRVILVGATGKRHVESFESERKADEFAADARGEAEGRSVSGAVDAWLASKTNLRQSTITRAEYHLRRILRLSEHGSKPLRWLTAARGAELYELAKVGAAVDTHRGDLAEAKAFGKWCLKKGWLKANPFGDVEGAGRKRRGKPQHRIDEARRLTALCLELAPEDDAAVAVLVAQILGPRATETATRAARDVDDGGRQLVIPESKTDSGKRSVEIPDVLRPHLLRLAAGKPPEAPIFADSDGAPRTRYWLYYHVGRLCDLAKVPRISPQGLRGGHASMATGAGATSRLVAEQLGHAGPSITEAAYIDPHVLKAEKQRAAFAVLVGGRR
jgi:integrase